MASVSSFLPKLFRWVFTILLVFTCIGTVAIVVVMIVNPHIPVGQHWGPVAFDLGGLPGSAALTPAGTDYNLFVSLFKGTITLALNQAGGLFEVVKHYGLPVALLRLLFLVGLFELLRRLFRNVGRGESFTPGTVRLVQILGFFLIGSFFVLRFAEGLFFLQTYSYFAQHAVVTVSGTAMHLPQFLFNTATIAHGKVHVSHHYAVPHGNFFSDPLIFSGLLVLALSEVFRQGLALKKDNELTI